MSVIGSNILAGASGQGGGYNLTNSLRFRSSANAYLNRTPASAGNRQIWTWSGWVKRGALGVYSPLFIAGTTNGQQVGSLAFSSAGGVYDKLELNFGVQGTSTEFWLQTTQVFRDPSAWYHIVCAVDTTQATASNRVKFYVNGTQITALSSYGGYSQYPSQNYNTSVNNTVQHLISRDQVNTAGYFDGYLAEVNFIDGQALTPSSFGQTSAITGVWQPIKYTGTYGTNGFYLPFTDNSALTTSSNAGLGKDFSGNANYWTTNNISITSGSTYDSMTDVPTLTSVTAANYPTLNPLDDGANITLSEANLSYSVGATNMVRATMQLPNTGKWYWECTQTSANAEQFGIATSTASLGTYLGGDANGWCYGGSGNKFNNNTSTAYGASFTNGDVIGVAFDATAGTLTFYKNNVSQGTAFSSLTGLYFPAVGGNLSSGAINFGQRPFTYTPPTGFVRLNTFNLPTPTIGASASTQANDYFDVSLYTGNSGTQSITNSGSMQPDFVWLKQRGNATSHCLTDNVRGVNSQLISNSTDAQYTATDCVTAINSNGFTLGANTQTAPNVNFTVGGTFVGWQWKANGAGSSNTAGSITSTVSANTTAGFSIATFTGNGTGGATVGHGLGVTPSMVIVKKRSGVADWAVQHISLGANASLRLNGTDATANEPWWNSTAPSSTVFTLGSSNTINQSGETFVAYCFAQVAGYSAFGSYTGNGSTDGPFVFTGFRPRYVMIKRTDTTNNWVIQDTSRDTYNVSEKDLYADTSGAEATYAAEKTDILSNGFKQRQTGASMNASGGTYIYMAFAENPFKYSLAR